MRYKDLLLEAQKYETMFTTVLAWFAKMAKDGRDSHLPSDIAQNLKWAKQKLKKNDRIVWYLRQYRLCSSKVIKQHYGELFRNSNGENFNEEMDAAYKLDSRYEAEAMKYGATPIKDARDYSRFISTTKGRLEHFLSLPIAAIQNYVFTDQTAEKVFADFTQFEEEWQAEQEQMFDHEDEDIVIEFPDGMMWVNLDRAYCEQEATSMGHCGNSPRSRSNDRILSLRKLVVAGEQKYWHPFLTFILDESNNLTEMKGRANAKPAARYHPYIVALLRNPIIHGIKGGGYMPENNFSLSDLPEEEQEALAEEKPALRSPEFLFKQEGLTRQNGNIIADWINEETRINVSYDDKDNSIVTDVNWDEMVSPLVEKYTSSDLENADFINEKYDREEFIEQLKTATRMDYKACVEHRIAELTQKQRAYIEKVIKLLAKKGKLASVRQPDLFGGPDRYLDIEETFIRIEAEEMANKSLSPVIAKISEIIGWKRIQTEYNSYVDTIRVYNGPRYGYPKKIGDTNYLAFEAHDLGYMIGDDDGYGEVRLHEIDYTVNETWGEDGNTESMYEAFKFDLPKRENSWTTLDPEIIWKAFLKDFVGQSPD